MNTEPVMRQRWLWLCVVLAFGFGWGLAGRALGCSPAF